jgi:multimeric flavodoxin WrbA
MKILTIRGSPRKGNTYRAVRRIEENLKAMGDVQFEYLWLKDAGLADCKGCTVCLKSCSFNKKGYAGIKAVTDRPKA